MGAPAQRNHVLLIHDTPAILDHLCEVLKAAGHQVTGTGATLDLPRLRALAPALIVQDLPGGDQAAAGWDFLTLVQLAPDLARIPLILCTAIAETVDSPAVAANLDRRGIRVLLKPFTGEELLTAIGELLTAQALLDQVRLKQ